MKPDDNRRMMPLPLLDGAVELTHWGLIRACGVDACSFLQGQLTNDFSGLSLLQARLAGYCSAKGRLQASFVGWKRAHDDVLLACNRDILEATLKRLSMFVLRSRCKLSDASAEFRLFGMAGPSALALLGDAAPRTMWGKAEIDSASVVRLADTTAQARFLWSGPRDLAVPKLEPVRLDEWRLAEVLSGIPAIEAVTVDRFVPQMLNFELVGGVDFQKGCYPGQEVVARTQYRGTIKRRMFLFTCEARVLAGQEVFHCDDPDQPAGMVVNAAAVPSLGEGSTALVEVKLAALRGGSLHLGSAVGPIFLQVEMPYLVPDESMS